MPVLTRPAADGAPTWTLVERARTGCRESFGLLYGEYAPMVHRYVRQRVATPSLAEDLTSETFLRALRGIDGFRWRGRDFGAWLVTIARNLVADHYKSGHHRLEYTTPEPPENALEGPERLVLESMTNRALLLAVGRLGAEQRECVILRFLHGLSVAETAAVMGKNTGAVRALQHRAVRTLARTLPADPRLL